MVHATLEACDELAARGHLGRGDRPAHGRAARHRDDPAIGAQDRPAADRGRGVRARAASAPRSPRRSPTRGFDDLDAPIRRLNGALHADAVQPAAGGRRRARRRRRSRRRFATCWRSEASWPIAITVPRLGWNMEEGVVRRLAEGRRRRGPRRRAAVRARRREGGCRRSRASTAASCASPRTGPKQARPVAVGRVIGYLLQPGEADAGASGPSRPSRRRHRTRRVGRAPRRRTRGLKPKARVRITPRARRLARALGIDASSLRGTGRNGRIRERDVKDVSS